MVGFGSKSVGEGQAVADQCELVINVVRKQLPDELQGEIAETTTFTVNLDGPIQTDERQQPKFTGGRWDYLTGLWFRGAVKASGPRRASTSPA